jgi:hypothetical protein
MNISVYRSNKCSYCNLPGHNLRSCQADGAALVRQSRETPEQREKKIEQERLRAEKNRVAEIERQRRQAEKQLEKERLRAESIRALEMLRQAAIEAAIERERQAALDVIVDFRRRPEEFQTLTDEQKNWTFKQIQRRMKIEIQRNRERVAEFDEIIRIENQRRELYNTTIINFKNEINNLKAIALNLISNESIFNKLNITVKKNEATMDADSLLKPVECGICYQTYENNQFIGLNCNHEFCKQCIITCLRKEKKQRACCAMCRSNINTMMYKGEVF